MCSVVLPFPRCCNPFVSTACLPACPSPLLVLLSWLRRSIYQDRQVTRALRAEDGCVRRKGLGRFSPALESGSNAAKRWSNAILCSPRARCSCRVQRLSQVQASDRARGGPLSALRRPRRRKGWQYRLGSQRQFKRIESQRAAADDDPFVRENHSIKRVYMRVKSRCMQVA